jgi:hypothetical protein
LARQSRKWLQPSAKIASCVQRYVILHGHADLRNITLSVFVSNKDDVCVSWIFPSVKLPGASWSFLEASWSSWSFQEKQEASWRFLEVPGGSWKLQEASRSFRETSRSLQERFRKLREASWSFREASWSSGKVPGSSGKLSGSSRNLFIVSARTNKRHYQLPEAP